MQRHDFIGVKQKRVMMREIIQSVVQVILANQKGRTPELTIIPRAVEDIFKPN
jgi:hypothetical protein